MKVSLRGYSNFTNEERVGLDIVIKDLDELPEVIREFMQIHKELHYKVEVSIT